MKLTQVVVKVSIWMETMSSLQHNSESNESNSLDSENVETNPHASINSRQKCGRQSTRDVFSGNRQNHCHKCSIHNGLSSVGKE